MILTSSRFFTVKLPDSSVELNDVLYSNDPNRGYLPLYLRYAAPYGLVLVSAAYANKVGQFTSPGTHKFEQKENLI